MSIFLNFFFFFVFKIQIIVVINFLKQHVGKYV